MTSPTLPTASIKEAPEPMKVVAVISERGLQRLSEGKAHCVHAYAKVVDDDDTPLCRLSDFESALQAAIKDRDAEIERLKKDAARNVPTISTLFGMPGTLLFKTSDGRWFYMNHANTWQSCPAPFSAAMGKDGAHD